ncbi:glycosyltransferase family 1 protein [Bacillus songklensis]|uniref:Glycosyltransferase family 1 protein n=1 Tax=Bacillus songklensis TaxID=1069116 RepID=A0ABV8B5Z7_9BACI
MDTNKKIKVLQVLGGLWSGGTEAFVMNMYRSIDREKVEFDFLIHEKSKAHYDDEVLSLGGRIYRIPGRHEVGTLKYIVNLVRVLRKIKPDVIHSHAMFNSGVVMLAAFLAGIKKRISHSHNTSDQGGGGISRKIFRFIMRLCIFLFSTNLAACSNKAAKYLFFNKTYSKKQALILNNAVNINDFIYNEKLRHEARNELCAGGKLVLGHVGRFTEQKNHHFLIDIFKSVHDQYPDSMLVMVGDGPLRPGLETKVAELGLSLAVKFLGVRNDIPKLLQGIDLFVLPSLYEGLPVVLIEAQAAGLSCILSDTITRDTDITGRVKFIGLNASPNIWAHEILSSPSNHEDTSEMIRRNGYDTATTAKRLADLYINKAI